MRMRARRRNDNFCVFENRERWKVNSCLNERGRENECKSKRIHIECLPGQLVVAQLVERSLPTPVQIQLSANFSIEHKFNVNCVEKTKIKKKSLRTT